MIKCYFLKAALRLVTLPFSAFFLAVLRLLALICFSVGRTQVVKSIIPSVTAVVNVIGMMANSNVATPNQYMANLCVRIAIKKLRVCLVASVAKRKMVETMIPASEGLAA